MPLAIQKSITVLPGLQKCTELRVLEAEDSGLATIPALSALTKLEVLNLRDCKGVKGALPSLDTQVALKTIDLAGTSITELPSVSSLGKLTILKLGYYDGDNMDKTKGIDIKSLPDGFDQLVSLEHLDVTGCSKIKEIPSLAACTNLQKLHFEGCKGVKKLPELPEDKLDELLDEKLGIKWPKHSIKGKPKYA